MTEEKLKIKWVTKFVKFKEWEEYYSHLPNYTLVRKVPGGLRIGFLVVNEVPNDCLEATEEEKEIIRKDRIKGAIYPLP